MQKMKKMKKIILGAATLFTISIIVGILIVPLRVQAKSTIDLQDTITKAKSGSTVTIPSGTYTIKTTLDIKNKKKITIVGDGKVVIQCSEAAQPVISISGCGTVNIKNITLTHSAVVKKTAASAAVIKTSTNVSISSCDLGTKSTYGIEVYDTDSLSLTSCKLHDCSKSALFLENLGSLTITKTMIKKNTGFMSGKEIAYKDGGSNSIELSEKEQLTKDVKNAMKYAEKKDYKTALALMDNIIKKYPDNAEVYWRRGEIYVKMSNKEAAQIDLIKAGRLDPELGWPVAILGNTFYDSSMTKEALECYLEAIGSKGLKENPDSYWVYEKIGDIYMGNDDMENAEKYYLTAYQYNSAATKIKDFAIDYFLKGNNDEAGKVVNAVIKQAPDDMASAWAYLWRFNLTQDKKAGEADILKAASLDHHYSFYIIRTSMQQTTDQLKTIKSQLDNVIEALKGEYHQEDAVLFITRAEIVRQLYKDEADSTPRTDALNSALSDLEQADRIKDLPVGDVLFDPISYEVFISWYQGSTLIALGDFEHAKICYDNIDTSDQPGDISYHINEDRLIIEEKLKESE